MKKTVLHILNTGSYSGAENVVLTLINAINSKDSGYRFIYVSLEGSIKDILDSNGIEYEVIDKLTISEIRRVVNKYHPDIIHAHDFTAGIICGASLIKIPIICHLHNNKPWIKQVSFFSIVFLLSCFRYKEILMVSDAIFNEFVFKKFVKNKCSIISNPINISQIKEKALLENGYNQYNVIFIGRLSEAKNPIRFINIIEKLVNRYPDLRAAMIGDGELKDQCIVMIKNKNLTKNIEMLGFLYNPYSLLAKSKIICMTSLWEGFGLVAVEALALGIPVISTPVGGLTQIVDMDCGFFYTADNEACDEITKLLTDNDYYMRKSENAIIRANQLNNLDIYISTILSVYERHLK
jgi:glycosyltransferase involved in cell wall biosynthesis